VLNGKKILLSFDCRAALRHVLLLAVVAGAAVLSSAPYKSSFTPRDKAYYADSNTINFVRPGLKIAIVSASIAKDGTATVDFKMTDADGFGLDRHGVVAPGAISTSLLIGYVPKGQTHFLSYPTRSRTSAPGKTTVVQATSDSGSTYSQVAAGEYLHVRHQSPGDLRPDGDAPGGHLRQSQSDGVRPGHRLCPRHPHLGSGRGNGGATRRHPHAILQQVPRPARLAWRLPPQRRPLHHVPPDAASRPERREGRFQGDDPQNPRGQFAPERGGGRKICNRRRRLVNCGVFPSDWRRGASCHESTTSAAQADTCYTNPSRAACGSCHDHVNFASGRNHVNLPQVDGRQCATCHIPQGELEFEASIQGAHILPQESAARPGLVVTLKKVDNGVAGKARPSPTHSRIHPRIRSTPAR
jgi:hypothetical protein